MQLRFATNISVEQYIQQEAWKYAELDQCPLHPEGGCKLARHGTYSRKFPDGVKIARYYCAIGRTTFGLLPDCLSSRLPGTLIEVETVINQIESAPSQEAAADNIRPDIGLPGVLRWASLDHHQLLLYLFLIIVADRNGLSYYSYDKICTLLRICVDDYILARNALIDKDLLAFDGYLYQVLSLPERVVQPTTAPLKSPKDMDQHNPATICSMIQQSFGDSHNGN